MEIEVGKFYKDRSGRRVRIYCLDGDKDNEIRGAVIYGGEWVASTWNSNGDFMGRETKYDIVSEWEEPKKKVRLYAYLYNIDKTLNYLTKEINSVDYIRLPNLDQEIEE